jgi:hypothetical protein
MKRCVWLLVVLLGCAHGPFFKKPPPAEAENPSPRQEIVARNEFEARLLAFCDEAEAAAVMLEKPVEAGGFPTKLVAVEESFRQIPQPDPDQPADEEAQAKALEAIRQMRTAQAFLHMKDQAAAIRLGGAMSRNANGSAVSCAKATKVAVAEARRLLSQREDK